jgi:DedD protein
LVIGGLVVLGAVFVLGVVVGKKLAVAPGSSESSDLLSTLDRKAQDLEKVRTAPPLTFQDELTKKGGEPVQDAGHLAPPPQLDPAAAAAKAKPEVAQKPAIDPVLNRPVAEKAEPSAHPPAPKPEAPEPKPAAKPVATAEASTPARPTSLREAIARAERAPAPQEETAPKGGSYTLQLAASPTRAEADRHVAKLRGKGYAPYVVAAELPGKGTWYRVRMGSFTSKEAAEKFLADFRRETQLTAFVASVP